MANYGGKDHKDKCHDIAARSAFKNCGKEVGLEVWRIENFEPVSWKDVGHFYSGDSYIVLSTAMRHGDHGALMWDIHFWIGTDSSADEKGSAAYMTVILDDVLHGRGSQHREVQDHESDLFLSHFDSHSSHPMVIMEGGIDSGFNNVVINEEKVYKPRLLWVKGKMKKMRVRQVPVKC